MAPVEEENAYDLLGITMEATEGEIRTAYRQRSLKVHPDRHPNNPQAAHKFHELNQAYELLLDPIRRLALDAKVRLKEAHKERFAKYDKKRKGMQEELEAAEREFKRRKEDEKKKGKQREEENERVKEEGRKMREEAELKAAERAAAAAKAAKTTEQKQDLGPLDTTIRLKYAIARYPELVTAAALGQWMRRFGDVDEGSIVISMKAPKKSPDKPAKTVVALVPFAKVGDAFAAVCARGKAGGGLDDMEVGWAGGQEPEAVRWLQAEKAAPPPSVDFETATIMRMRQAERDRLER
ncbi:DnaJ-domain-containing protein, partial [Sistotremastrum suecicum HHB10207 ss-3]